MSHFQPVQTTRDANPPVAPCEKTSPTQDLLSDVLAATDVRGKQTPVAAMTAATVDSVDNNAIAVHERGGAARSAVAERAASCLLEPQVGDEVLVAWLDAGQRACVIAVLLRHDPAALAALKLPAQTQLSAATSIVMTAPQSVALQSAGSLKATARRIAVTADAVSTVSQTVDWFAKSVRGHGEKVSLLANTLQQSVTTLRTSATRAYRTVKEWDQWRAGQIDMRAENTVQIKGETTAIIARKVAKMDGEQVHIG